MLNWKQPSKRQPVYAQTFTMDRLIDADSPTLINAYEARIKKLETDKLILKEKTGNSARPTPSFDSALRTALQYVYNLHEIWVQDYWLTVIRC